ARGGQAIEHRDLGRSPILQPSNRLKQRHFNVTSLFVEPPRLLLTVMVCGLVGQVNRPLNLPPPMLVSVPINWFVAASKTCSVALLLVLVASTRSCFVARVNSARVMVTVSASATAATVSVADCVTPPAVAEMAAVVDAVTVLVVTMKVALVNPAGTVTLAGTVAETALLLASVT